MLSGLLREVERTEIPVCGEAIAAAIRARDVLSAKIAEAVGEYDAMELAVVDGAHSTTGFLRQCGVARPSLEVKLARRMRVRRHGAAVTCRPRRSRRSSPTSMTPPSTS